MRIAALLFLATLLGGCSALPCAADPASDAPEHRYATAGQAAMPAIYAQALNW